MSLEPSFMSSYGDAAADLLSSGGVKDVEFSSGTYQIEVQGPKDKEGYWAFLQFDPDGSLQDSFCSCDAYDDSQACLHLASAYHKVCRTAKPLHERFQLSFWSQLGRLYAKRYPDEDFIKKQGSAYVVDKDRVRIEPKSAGMRKLLTELVDERKPATEENSIKFSNLSDEELELWNEGIPSFELLYELSFWSDLAKLLFLKQDAGEDYSLSFEEDAQGLPERVLIKFKSIEASFAIPKHALPNLIPTLATVRAPLTVLDRQESHLRLQFDPKRLRLLIDADEKREEEGISIGDWSFIPGEGFYRSYDTALLKEPVIDADSLGDFFDEHWELVRNNLPEHPLHTEVHSINYALGVTLAEGLTVTAYLREEGDITHLFGSWVFIAGEGFYRVSGARFPSVKTEVPGKKLAGFIAEYRQWLNAHDGYHVHLARVEARLSYNMSADNTLYFESELLLGDHAEDAFDFGEWVFIEGTGFFSKRAAGAGTSLQGGLEIPEHKIARFIREHRLEVEQVPGFFSERSPVSSVGLHIALMDQGDVIIEPRCELRPAFRERDVRFFGEFVYIAGDGFHAIPFDKRVPERFHRRCRVAAADLPLFLSYELEDLRAFAVDVDPRLCHPRNLELVVSEITPEDSRFNLKISYRSEHGTARLGDLMASCSHGTRYVVSEAGIIDLELSRFDWMRQLTGEGREFNADSVTLSTMELIRIHAFDDLSEAYQGGEEEIREWLEQLTTFSMEELPSTKGLRSKLRSYQKVGLQWLWFLYRNRLSGLLCDDMGLGKTHQSMALLAAVREQIPRPPGRGSIPPPFLIVCPTSVLYHWQEKLAEFLPKLKVYTFYGVKRSLEHLKKKRYDILLTSYGVLRVDREALSDLNFNLAILDEVQVAKNHSSRIHHALLGLNAGMRLGLTGTPIENRLREIKSLFDIVLPGYMPSDSHFREFFVQPIEKDGDESRKALLSAYVRPFILRRKKMDVLDDLPEKTEEVGHCDLFPEQRSLYDEIASQARKRLLGDLKDDGKPVPYVHIFAVITHLKQICNHPAAYHKDGAGYQQYASGKWNLFKELLNEAIDSEQKVVVFSQYLTMLDIMEKYLQEIGVDYATVRGDTRDRPKQLKRFRDEERCQVFLGSLQAVGLGVDLTAASVVIHYDRWWNPARENQATDRVHRIGQKRGVQVFKLVSVGTVEERIDALIARKGRLAEDILGRDDENLLKALTRDQLMELLQDVSGSHL